jgi:hypothetical protein
MSSVDPRLASANTWTAVSNDIDLLVSIFSSWTELEYCYYHYLDREAFLDDMASGRTDFCSELLVNALLASACVSTRLPAHCHTLVPPDMSAYFWQFTSALVENRSKPFSEHSIMTTFFKEATRLWDLERDDKSLTRIQAGICLCKFHHPTNVMTLFLRLSHQFGLPTARTTNQACIHRLTAT